jgi:hypothetical protein
MRGTLFAALAAVLSLIGAQGQSPITKPPIAIDESKIQATLKNDSTSIVVPIASTLDREVRAQLTLEWIDKEDKSIASTRHDILIPPGGMRSEVPFAIPKPTLWLRLRYSLTPGREYALAFAPHSGIVALSEIAQHIFELKVTHVGEPHPGMPFIIHAQAIHPATRVPVGGVKWTARLTFDKTEQSPSDISPQAEGIVNIAFDIPPAAGDNPEGLSQLTVKGTLGDFSNEVMTDIPIPSRLSARIQTDKPIYQPGQTLHVRAVILDPQGKAMDGATVVLRIDDQDNDRMHTSHLVTSRSGVIHEDWSIPATTGLGAFQIAVTTEDDEDYTLARHAVRISRYELPDFNVVAKPDRAAYLADQKTKVSVTGTYLFDKPVPRGHVKVSRAGEGRWNPKTRKYEATSETVAEGQAGEDGTFVAELQLKEDHEELQKSDYERFQDVHFVAYYTDSNSGRTEQRRFDVRITREPIHVYVLPVNCSGPLPVPVYVSTSYADGNPASTSVEIRYHSQVATLHTNRYGVGKTFLMSDKESDENGEVTVRASDSSGQIGTWVEHYWHPGLEVFRMETGRAIYHAGEAVDLQISTPPGDTTDRFVVVNAIADGQSIASQIVRLVDGKAQITFPYQPKFRRLVTFSAWNAGSAHSAFQYNVLAAKTVIFPDASDLKLTASSERAIYKPGDKATLHMQVSSSDGRPVEAALGLAIVDQAVLERARTDAEFGQRPWFACAFCQNSGETEIGGVRLNDLYALKSSTAISPDLDLVAEALVARESAYIWSEAGESLQDPPKFASVASQLAQIQTVLDHHYLETLEFPKDLSALTRIAGHQWESLSTPGECPIAQPSASIATTMSLLS